MFFIGLVFAVLTLSESSVVTVSVMMSLPSFETPSRGAGRRSVWCWDGDGAVTGGSDLLCRLRWFKVRRGLPSSIKLDCSE